MSETFIVPEDCVWLASFPRSGNTLLRLTLFHRFGIKTASQYGKNEFQPELCDLIGVDQSSRFVKTHERYKLHLHKTAIHIWREKTDCIESCRAHRLDPNAWCGGYDAHLKSWQNVNCLHLRFEELKTDNTIRQLSDFLGVKPKLGKLPAFAKLHAMNEHFFRKAGFDETQYRRGKCPP